MVPYILAGFLASSSLVVAQTIGSLTASRTGTATDTLFATRTASVTNSAVISPTNVPTGQACAVVSSLLAQQAGGKSIEFVPTTTYH